MTVSADVLNRFFSFPPYVPREASLQRSGKDKTGGRGCSSLPSQSTLGSYGVLREAQR